MKEGGLYRPPRDTYRRLKVVLWVIRGVCGVLAWFCVFVHICQRVLADSAATHVNFACTCAMLVGAGSHWGPRDVGWNASGQF